MKLCELAKKLNITPYPEFLESVYENLSTDSTVLYDTERIRALDTKYEIFGEYLDIVTRGAEELKSRADYLLYARVMAEYQKNATMAEVRMIPVPTTDGTPAGDIMPLLVLISEVEEMIKKYEIRGFSPDQIKRHLAVFRINLWVCSLLCGRPYFDSARYKWACNYIKAEIFDHKAFNFQPCEWRYDASLLRNKNTGEHVFVMSGGICHRSGQILGSAGYKDEEGSFAVTFTENDSEFVANPVTDGLVSPETKSYKKSEWECVLKKGDACVSLHIPRNTDLTPDYVEESLREGLILAKKHYPEMNIKYLVCGSWMLDRSLPEILVENSKLSKFNQRFLKIPILSSGAPCMQFVFPGFHNESLENLPEDTSLQRGIKTRILRGEHILATAGAIVD